MITDAMMGGAVAWRGERWWCMCALIVSHLYFVVSVRSTGGLDRRSSNVRLTASLCFVARLSDRVGTAIPAVVSRY